jgi:hypothetical protein
MSLPDGHRHAPVRAWVPGLYAPGRAMSAPQAVRERCVTARYGTQPGVTHMLQNVVRATLYKRLQRAHSVGSGPASDAATNVQEVL